MPRGAFDEGDTVVSAPQTTTFELPEGSIRAEVSNGRLMLIALSASDLPMAIIPGATNMVRIGFLKRARKARG